MARARKTDPQTSHDAAREAEASGRAATHRAICLEEVRKNSGRTAAEIAVETGLERHVPSRRLPELRDAGLVENREVRVCRVTGRNSMTWYAVAEEIQ
jgi:predicted ArsR family transcriptional regulator